MRSMIDGKIVEWSPERIAEWELEQAVDNQKLVLLEQAKIEKLQSETIHDKLAKINLTIEELKEALNGKTNDI